MTNVWQRALKATTALIVAVLGTTSSLAEAQSPPLAIAPNPTDFGVVVTGQRKVLDVTATNRRSTTVIIRAVRVSPPFSIVENSCGGLEPGALCTVRVSFAPATAAKVTTPIMFESDAGISTGTLLGQGSPAVTTTKILPPPAPTTTSSSPPGPTTSVPPTTSGPGPTITPPTPPGPGPGPTTTIRPSDQQAFDDCERRAESAKVTYEPVRQMRVRKTERVVVTVAVEGDPGTTVVTHTSPTTIVTAKLRCEVEVALRGSDFDVNPDGSQAGSFLDRSAITWSWDVVPNKRGDTQLTLDIKSVAVIDGRRLVGAGGQLLTTVISVEAEPEDLVAQTTRWSEQVVDHPLVRGFGSLVVVAGGLAAGWRWLVKRPWPWTRNSSG